MPLDPGDWAEVFSAGFVFMATIAAMYALHQNQEATKANSMQTYLQRYLEINAHYYDHTTTDRQYYEELFDLLWNEFHLWRRGGIHDDIIYEWLKSHLKKYNQPEKVETEILNTPTGMQMKTTIVHSAYKDWWKVNKKRLGQDSLFCTFMDTEVFGKEIIEKQKDSERKEPDKDGFSEESIKKWRRKHSPRLLIRWWHGNFKRTV